MKRITEKDANKFLAEQHPELATIVEGIPFLGTPPIKPIMAKLFNPCQNMQIVSTIVRTFEDCELLDYVRYLTEPLYDTEPSFSGYTKVATAHPRECVRAIMLTRYRFSDYPDFEIVKEEPEPARPVKLHHA